MKRTSMWIGVIACGVPGMVAAQPVVYYGSHGFEAPAYQLGPFAGMFPGGGQEQWTARYPMKGTLGPPWPDFERIKVQGERVHSGAAAVKFDAAGHPETFGVELVRQSSVSLVHPLVQVDMDLYWESAAELSQRWLFRMHYAPQGPTSVVQIEPDGEIRAGLGFGGPPTLLAGTFQRDTWHHLRQVLDYGTSTIDIRLDGQSIGTVGFPAINVLERVAFYVPERGTDALYIDNLEIVNLPDAPCYPDCNADGTLTVGDFGCFQTKFVAGDPYADCNADGLTTVADFGCFQTKFVTGCP